MGTATVRSVGQMEGDDLRRGIDRVACRLAGGAGERHWQFAASRGPAGRGTALLPSTARPTPTRRSPKRPSWPGYGAGNLRLVPVVKPGREMDVSVLASLLAEDVRVVAGRPRVVATAGTTATTAFDPIADVCEVAESYDAFVHVDAAMAGSAMLLAECRELFDGIEGANSISWNPHKWLGSVLETSLFYVRQPEVLCIGDGYRPELPALDARWVRRAVPGLGPASGAAVPGVEALGIVASRGS